MANPLWWRAGEHDLQPGKGQRVPVHQDRADIANQAFAMLPGNACAEKSGIAAPPSARVKVFRRVHIRIRWAEVLRPGRTGAIQNLV